VRDYGNVRTKKFFAEAPKSVTGAARSTSRKRTQHLRGQSTGMGANAVSVDPAEFWSANA